MSVKWWVIIIILAVLLTVVAVQAYLVFKEKNSLGRQLGDLNAKLESLKQENEDLRAEIKYFSYPENLEKELKSKFNYRKPDEKMLIIIP